MNAADVLDRAADYLDENGWVQARFIRGEAVCALQAIYAVQEPAFRYDVQDALGAYLLTHGLTRGGVVKWNDKYGQTAENVTATMRACAASLRDPS